MSLLNKIKSKVNTGKPIDEKKLIEEVENYDVVSFDIFDTLLKRNVSCPSDVFAYIEEKYQITDFREKRISAEKRARQISDSEEITLQDIYKEYGEDYSQEELDAESKLLTVNSDILPVFLRCVRSKRVIIVSDMYLPECFICAILAKLGVAGYERLFLSSTIGLTKRSGALFKYVMDEMGISAGSIIHIGDSVHSDYRIPKRLGISAVHIPTYTKRASYQLAGSHYAEGMVNAFINNTTDRSADDYDRFGYERFGMFLWGYCKWLHDSIVSENIDRVYFFSRDGLIMKKAFDSLYGDLNTYYLEVSRRALRVPILWMNYKLEHVIDMISPSKLVPLSTIFDGVGLDIQDYKALLAQYGFESTTCFDRSELLVNQKLRALYDALSDDIERNSKKEYSILADFLMQNGLGGTFAIVDIGWSGGMQRYLCEALDAMKIDCRIKGFYIGVADYFTRNKNILLNLDLNGYLFDFSHDADAVDKRSPFVGLFETLFLEQAGSVQKYERDGDVIKAKRLPYEYVVEGKSTYELACIRKVQDGALDFVKKFGVRDICLPASVLFSGLEETGLRPTKKDLRLFADFRFFDEGESRYLAKPKSLLWYIVHIKEFKKDFLLSRWKIGFMKRLLKLKLPYEKMYRFMLKYK